MNPYDNTTFMFFQMYTLERLAAGDLTGAGPLLGALAAALARLHKGAPEWAPFAATLARRLAVRFRTYSADFGVILSG